MNINQYAVYQLKESAELAAYRSRSYQYLTEHHFQVIVQNYQQAYFTKLFTSDTPEIIRKRLEEHRPKNKYAYAPDTYSNIGRARTGAYAYPELRIGG